MSRLDFSSECEDVEDSHYDLYEDYALIEASFAQQYGIRLRNEDEMSWNEFCTLLSGLMPDTPLGRVVSIRAETDPDIIKNFNEEQRRIYNEWRSRIIRKRHETPEAYKRYAVQFQQSIKDAFCHKK